MPLKDLIATPEDLPFLRALRALRAAGRNVAPSDIPGLTYVDGHELTIGQVLALASQDAAKR